ncbi:SAM-dependent methyltransferase [Streptomyces agglomeratus]|uniref:SAM-dependent methyltransferase n=1 Tax=Streptomyces agglomeratus TaxID=285458 RepID=A0A1E5PEM3_9ACTN|nr:class I SAM-dependent methyltransferase [Streptomyces agglomeratus]OEJ27991.1 SAM-dependent methyltransferase [Streptomyces agglomeratus]OEJ37948.1 SAM-dependent methyltransferase [Streptomyces agglomeratus]OEJ47670.1 SAM-dependent methyltransferase [Streptomyces agglomeratus]OEJ50476.1 SAM-dependent methyltransferase [Streptomyces agglomeratus]OEJ57828.1 SAM-dependent methyltransferase [Streptomyces agglomeratus]
MYGPEFAEIYDHVYTLRGKDYPAESKYVAEQIRSRSPGASSLLDVACGTGGHLRCFDELFDDVEGLELSEAMLSVARRRMPATRLHQGDMRAFDIGRTYDAVVCMFASVAHQSAAELATTMRRFARHLRPGGVVVVEPWWFPENFAEGYVAADVLTPDHRTISRVSHARREGGASRMDVHYVVADPGSGIRHFTETYLHQLFPRDLYERTLRQAGFATEYVEGTPSGRGLFVGIREEAVSA